MPSCPDADVTTVSARAIRQGRGYIGGQRQFSALGAVNIHRLACQRWWSSSSYPSMSWWS